PPSRLAQIALTRKGFPMGNDEPLPRADSQGGGQAEAQVLERPLPELVRQACHSFEAAADLLGVGDQLRQLRQPGPAGDAAHARELELTLWRLLPAPASADRPGPEPGAWAAFKVGPATRALVLEHLARARQSRDEVWQTLGPDVHRLV